MNILDNYTRELELIYSNQKVIAIILFGSYVKKQNSALSDIDVCILTKKTISEKEKYEILSQGDEKLDLSLFDELPLAIQYKIMTEGKILKTKKDLTSLRINIINNWRDFKPILNRIYKSKGLLPIM